MQNNSAYRAYCKQYRDTIRLFYQDWWLDAVAGQDQWTGLVSEKTYEGKAAIMPIVLSRKYGLKLIRRPKLTTYQGPFWNDLLSVNKKKAQAIIATTWPELVSSIPANHSFRHTLFPGQQFALPFINSGYNVSLKYTYTLSLAQPLAEIHKNFKRDTKRNIKKHHIANIIAESDCIDQLWPLVKAVYQRQTIPAPFKKEKLQLLFNAIKRHHQARLFYAKNEDNETIGGLLLAYDSHRVYVLISGLQEAGRKNGAMQALIWHAIQRFHPSQRIFDFCGSMIPSVAASNRSFGAIAQPVLSIEKTNSFIKILRP